MAKLFQSNWIHSIGLAMLDAVIVPMMVTTASFAKEQVNVGIFIESWSKTFVGEFFFCN
jgi:hypothetical protein